MIHALNPCCSNPAQVSHLWVCGCLEHWVRPKSETSWPLYGALEEGFCDGHVALVAEHADRPDPRLVETLAANADTTRHALEEKMRELGCSDPNTPQGRLYVLTSEDLAEVLAELISEGRLDAVEVFPNLETIFQHVQEFLFLDFQEEMARLAQYACARDPDD